MLTDDSLDVIPGRPEGEPGIPLRNLEIFGFAADAALRNDGMKRQSHNTSLPPVAFARSFSLRVLRLFPKPASSG
jgi:hypothetical protein